MIKNSPLKNGIYGEKYEETYFRNLKTNVS